jgi:hypothetical protein
MITLVRNNVGAATLMATKCTRLKPGKPANGKGVRDLCHARGSAIAGLSRKLARTRRRRRLTTGLAGAALCSLLCGPVAAVDNNGGQQTPPKGTADFGGFNWGIGIGTNFNMSGSRIGSATVVTDPNTKLNIVRVTDSSVNSVGVGFVLEAHYFMKAPYLWDYGPGDCQKRDKDNPTCSELAIGPFVAIEVGNGTAATPAANGPITGYALGMMVGLKRNDPLHPDSRSSWNFGVGLRVDPNARVLGDGIIANQPLPAGDSTSAIRYNTVARYGIMLLSSFSF